jgi:hypothetical protein
MTNWRSIPGETIRMFAPIGEQLVDDLTGEPPLGGVRAHLDLKVGAAFIPTDIRALVTASGVLTYPALGRVARPASVTPRHYRLRVDADYYRPLYLASADGLEFDASPYDDATPPAVIPAGAQDMVLAPSTAYPFPAYVSVLRGIVRDGGGKPVVNALVVEGPRERVLTDERGAFSLPLRWAPKGVPVPIDASDRLGRTGSISVQLPGSLETGQAITIT